MGQLQVQQLGRGIAWLDAGTHESLLQAANFIQAVQERQGIMISCPEEIAYRKGFISRNMLIEIAASYSNNGYGEYLSRLINAEI
jgi:glucose-1-phosphate thymidylyltransferase